MNYRPGQNRDNDQGDESKHEADDDSDGGGDIGFPAVDVVGDVEADRGPVIRVVETHAGWIFAGGICAGRRDGEEVRSYPSHGVCGLKDCGNDSVGFLARTDGAGSDDGRKGRQRLLTAPSR